MQQTAYKFQGAGGLALDGQSWQPDQASRAALLLVHGFGEHAGRYHYLVEHLTRRGFAVYGFDLRGHGRSPGPRGQLNHWSELQEDLRAFIDTVTNTQPTLPRFLFGHSFGGLIALNYVLQFPAGLQGVIASAPLLAQAKLSPQLALIGQILQYVKPDFPIDTHLDSKTLSRDPAEVQRYAQDPLVHSIGTPRLAHEIATTIAWTQQHAADLRLPLLLYHGGADALVPIAGSRTFYEHVTFPDKRWIEYPGGYHESHSDLERAKVFADLTAWLEAHL